MPSTFTSAEIRGRAVRITDAQVHVWEAPSPQRPWPEGSDPSRGFLAAPGARPHRAEPVGGEDMIGWMDEAGVERAVIVPPSPAGDSNDFALEVAARYPGRFCVMGRFDPMASNLDALEHWTSIPGMRGIRLTFHQPKWSAWLDSDELEPFWSACERHNVPVMMLAPGRLHRIARVAQAHPGLRLAIDHLGLHSACRGPSCEPDLDAVLSLATRPNISVKLSALPCYVDEPYPFESTLDWVRRLHKAFGADRLFWGSDVTRLPCSYSQAVRQFTEAIDFLSAEELDKIMGTALAHWLDWPLAEPAP
jgi:predicted TIM-barrel fold metal-dependent hydrolase